MNNDKKYELNDIIKRIKEEIDFINTDRNTPVTLFELLYILGKTPVGISTVPELASLTHEQQYVICASIEQYLKEGK